MQPLRRQPLQAPPGESPVWRRTGLMVTRLLLLQVGEPQGQGPDTDPRRPDIGHGHKCGPSVGRRSLNPGRCKNGGSPRREVTEFPHDRDSGCRGRRRSMGGRQRRRRAAPRTAASRCRRLADLGRPPACPDAEVPSDQVRRAWLRPVSRARRGSRRCGTWSRSSITSALSALPSWAAARAGPARSRAIGDPSLVSALVLLCPGVPGAPALEEAKNTPGEEELEVALGRAIEARDVDGVAGVMQRIWQVRGDAAGHGAAPLGGARDLEQRGA